jgi:hypothetical protein
VFEWMSHHSANEERSAGEVLWIHIVLTARIQILLERWCVSTAGANLPHNSRQSQRHCRLPEVALGKPRLPQTIVHSI